MAGGLFQWKQKLDPLFQQAGQNADINQANIYRQALEKSAYGDFGRQYGAGLGDISNFLARSGPLADSGAGTALRSKLASQLYGQAQGKIQGGYADYLRQLQMQRRNYEYQMKLQKQQQKAQGGFWNTITGIAGAVSPLALGGNKGGGGGGGYGSSGGPAGGYSNVDQYGNPY